MRKTEQMLAEGLSARTERAKQSLEQYLSDGTSPRCPFNYKKAEPARCGLLGLDEYLIVRCRDGAEDYAHLFCPAFQRELRRQNRLSNPPNPTAGDFRGRTRYTCNQCGLHDPTCLRLLTHHLIPAKFTDYMVAAVAPTDEGDNYSLPLRYIRDSKANTPTWCGNCHLAEHRAVPYSKLGLEEKIVDLIRAKSVVLWTKEDVEGILSGAADPAKKENQHE